MQHDGVAWFDVADARTGFEYGGRRFVAKQMGEEPVRPLGGGDLVELRATNCRVEDLDQNVPDIERFGQIDSSMINGSRDLARTAAFDFLICIVRRSLEIDELVVAGVSKVVVEPDPFRRVQDGFGGERPAFEVELLEFVPVALDHNVLILADALDLLHRGLQLVQT